MSGDHPRVIPAGTAAAFVGHPAAYMHASWWCDDWLPGGVFERLRRNPRSLARLSRFLIRTHSLDDVGPVAAGSLEATLVLAPAPRLDRLAALAGVTLLSGSIARILRGADRRVVQQAIGPDDYDFAIRRGRLLLHQARLDDRPDPALSDLAATAEDCERLGVGSLATALKSAPRGLTRRVQLKLPRESVERFWAPLASHADPFRRLLGLLDRQGPLS